MPDRKNVPPLTTYEKGVLAALRNTGDHVTARAVHKEMTALGFHNSLHEVQTALFGMERAGFINGLHRSHAPRRYFLPQKERPQ